MNEEKCCHRRICYRWKSGEAARTVCMDCGAMDVEDRTVKQREIERARAARKNK